MRAQEAANQEACTGPDQGGDAKSELGEYLAGYLHSRRSSTEAPRAVPVLASQHQPQEARGGAIFQTRAEDDHGENTEAVCAAGCELNKVTTTGKPAANT
jgi:hypothetical protein